MSRFASYDGTELAFRTLGDGRPLVCLPGGPGLNPDYLGDLGGLAGSRQLILLEVRERANRPSPPTRRATGATRWWATSRPPPAGST